MSRNLVCFFLVSGMIVTGCSSGDRDAVYPVKGTVTFEGEPMVGTGAIAFVPLENQPGKAPGGEIDDSGKYVLSTYGNEDGSIAGKFRVIITQNQSEEPEMTQDGMAPKTSTESVPARFLIPAIYSDFAKSPLTATVEKQVNEINFELKRQTAEPDLKPVQQTGA